MHGEKLYRSLSILTLYMKGGRQVFRTLIVEMGIARSVSVRRRLRILLQPYK